MVLPRHSDYDAIREHYSYTSRIYASKDDECTCNYGNRFIKPACLPITIVSLLIIALVFLPLFNEEDLESPGKLSLFCEHSCDIRIAESIPTGLNFTTGPKHKATHEEWIRIIDGADKFLDIAALYFNLNETDYETSKPGKKVLQALASAGRRGVKIRIAQDVSKGLSDNADSAWLQREGLAEVRTVNFSRLMGSGVLHTKFIIADLRTVYLGSANMDWKSLTEVKELGVVIDRCDCIATDLYKIFAVYWRLGEVDSKIPAHWPISFRTPYNFGNQLKVPLNNVDSKVFLSSSPAPFNPKEREHDKDAIVALMNSSDKSICIAVMDYLPTTLYMKNNSYWPNFDDAIRAAAFRGVHVRLLVSHWNHTRSEIELYLRSLVIAGKATKGTIEAAFFTVPSSEEQKKIPFARVNHNKFMVTDKTAYIGTSNWAGDYFITTAGVGLSISDGNSPNGMTKQLQDVFDRDWNSSFVSKIDVNFK